MSVYVGACEWSCQISIMLLAGQGHKQLLVRLLILYSPRRAPCVDERSHPPHANHKNRTMRYRCRILSGKLYISCCWRTTAYCDRSLTLSTVREDVRQEGNHADMQVMYRYSDWNSMPDKSMSISRTTKSFRDLSNSIRSIRWALITCCH